MVPLQLTIQTPEPSADPYEIRLGVALGLAVINDSFCASNFFVMPCAARLEGLGMFA